MSVLVLHNGNAQVKPWAADLYHCQPRTCITDPWAEAISIEDKISLAQKESICTDLTGADILNPLQLDGLKAGFKIIKVITSFEQDIGALEPIWKNFDQQQWFISSILRTSIADQTIFWDTISLTSTDKLPPVVFTPGRSGTHVIKDITGIHEYYHHEDDLISKPEFMRIVNASYVISVLRKSFFETAMSNCIARLHGFMVTTKENYQNHLETVQQWNQIEFKFQDAVDTLDNLTAYADLLLGLSMLYNKRVCFSLLDDLRHHFDKINHVKNPYKKSEIIANYDYAKEICDRIFQPVYDRILAKLVAKFETQIYST